MAAPWGWMGVVGLDGRLWGLGGLQGPLEAEKRDSSPRIPILGRFLTVELSTILGHFSPLPPPGNPQLALCGAYKLR